ncbi:MAG: discoidin domain-containing protein [Bacteroidia bacterium]|nr:discoidin domain-containing protein [Bacteroidia bacterium]
MFTLTNINIKQFSFILLQVLLFCSCNHPPRDVRMILNMAGENRPELEKVIDHFKESGNKEKLKAAYFLIGNMVDKYGMDGNEIRKYDQIFEILDSLKRNKILISSNSPYIQGKWDSLVTLLGTPSMDGVEIFPDYKYITADYLIENIDLSFKLRDESPWLKNISFGQFCEFVLPYRSGYEPLEPWRSKYYYKYKSVRDSINADSCLQFATSINTCIPRLTFVGMLKSYPFTIPFSKMEIVRHGACPHIVVFNASALRANGLPVSIDYAPLWGNRNAGHKWNVLLLENGKPYPFDRYWNIIRINYPYNIAKVYRETFARQNIKLPGIKQDVPEMLLNDHRIDVTQEYTKTFNIRIPLKYPFTPKKKYAVICTFNDTDWFFQDWGKIEKKQAYFKKIGSGIVYLAMYYDNGSLSPASDPFILTVEGNVSFLVPSRAETQKMQLIRKYPCFKSTQTYCNYMLDGNFQGANKADFRDSVMLFTITKSPEKIETATINNSSKFRYVRYRSPFKGTGDVAELEFYGGNKSSDTLKLGGKVIGFPEIPPTIGTPYQYVFDGNPETYFGRSRKGSSWAGLDFGTPKRITKIKYCPRSDTNFILVGDTYELCYWDNGEWVSMGTQVAKDQFLLYKNVPSVGLYILHNLSRGREERIFTYEDGKQVFW